MEELHHVLFDELDGSYEIFTTNVKFVAELLILFKIKNYIDLSGSKSAKAENMSIIAVHIFILAVSDSFEVICYYIYGVEFVLSIIQCSTSLLTILLMHPFMFSSGRILLQHTPEGKQNDMILKLLR